MDYLRSVVLGVKNTGRVKEADKKFFVNLNSVLTAYSGQHVKAVLKGVKDPAQLEALVKLREKAPGVPLLIALAEPDECGKIVLRFSADEKGIALLKSAARKGRAGSECLKKIRIVKFTIKNLYQGRFYDLLAYASVTDPAVRKYFLWGAGALFLTALFFLLSAFIRAGKFLLRRKGGRSEAEDGSRSPRGDNAPDNSNSGCSC